MKMNFVKKTAVLCLTSIIILSCSKDSKNSKIIAKEKLITTHSWYYLTNTGFEETDAPENSPLVIKKPWTESVRISGIGQTASIDSSPEEGSPKAFALVNHLGVIQFTQEKAGLFSDAYLFKDVTTDGIVFMNGNPVFSLYKNNIFNETSSENKKKNISVLVQFDTKSQAFFPILTTESLRLSPTSQVSDFYWDGTSWYYCIKDAKDNKTEFSYLVWKPQSSLLLISPEDIRLDAEDKKDRNVKITLQNSSEKEFRKNKEQLEFSRAPERVKKLLSCLPDDFGFTIECKTASGPSPRYYKKNAQDTDSVMEGKVQLSDSWVAAIFKDGTMYFSGALYEKRILNNSKPVALRLPRLPEGFCYTDFGISGTTLYAAWEENSFYETGRAGFLSVDLGKVLYNE